MQPFPFLRTSEKLDRACAMMKVKIDYNVATSQKRTTHTYNIYVFVTRLCTTFRSRLLSRRYLKNTKISQPFYSYLCKVSFLTLPFFRANSFVRCRADKPDVSSSSTATIKSPIKTNPNNGESSLRLQTIGPSRELSITMPSFPVGATTSF